MSNILVNTIKDTGNNTLLSSDGSGSVTASSSLASSVQSVGGIQMTPAFHAYINGTNTISDDTWTKVTFATELFDTDGCYDTSNYRFTPTTAGKYYIYTEVGYGRDTSNVFNAGQIHIYKNGSRVAFQQYSLNTVQNYMMQSVSSTIDFNGSSDYVEAYVLISTTSGTPRVDPGQDYCRFGGYKIIT